MRAFAATTGAAVLTAFLLIASSASAATEAGDDCVANTVEANRTMIAWNSGNFSMNRVAPAGVITAWKVRVGPGQAPLPERLETYRVLNEAEEYRQEAESSMETVGEGEDSFKTRIPVQVSASLGLYGPSGTFACNTGEPVVTGTFEGSAGLGEIRTVKGLLGFRTPVTVVVEPDKDGDGYGDLTQDECPQSAAIQVACPPVTLSDHAVAKKRSILLRVSASSEAQVHVYGQVSWGFKPKPGSHAGHRTGLVVGLSGGTKDVVPGKASLFKIPFSKPIMRRLGRLSPRESLKATITISAKDLAGRVTYRKLTVILRGQDSGA